jgi:hypothetical protein
MSSLFSTVVPRVYGGGDDIYWLQQSRLNSHATNQGRPDSHATNQEM